MLAVAITASSVFVSPIRAKAHWADEYIYKWKNYGILKNIDTTNPDKVLSYGEFDALVGEFEGIEKKTFNELPMSREAAIQELMRDFDIPESRTITKARKFKDFAQIDGSYAFYVEGAINAGIIETTRSEFKPKDPITLGEALVLLDRIADQTINVDGQFTYYGEDAKPFNNLIINEDYVTIINATINGNLYIAPGVGDGGVELEDTVVKGKMVIMGGGEAIRFRNCNIKELVVKRDNFPVTIVTDGGTTIEHTTVKSDAKLREQFFTELGFINMDIGDQKTFARVELEGEFGKVNVNEESLIDLVGESTIADLQFVSSANESAIRTSEDSEIKKITANDMSLPEYIGEVDVINVNTERKRTVVEGHVKRVNVNVNSFIDVKRDAVVDEIVIAKAAAGTSVYLDYNAKVKKLTANAITKVTGDGRVEVAEVNSNGVEIAKAVDGLILGSGIVSAKIENKVVKEAFDAPLPKTAWDNYLIRTNRTNLISVPSKEPVKLIIRKRDQLDKVSEPNLTWSILNGKGVNYSYIDPYTGVIEAQGDGMMTVTAFDAQKPELKTTQDIFVGNPDKWTKYPYRDYNMHTDIKITYKDDEEGDYLDRLRDKHNYQLKAELSPKHIKGGQVEWSITHKDDKDIKAQISQSGYLMIADDSEEGEIWITAKLKGSSYELIAQREFFVRRRYDDDIIDSAEFTLEAEKMPEDGTMTLTPVFEIDDKYDKDEVENKKKFEWKAEILDGRFTEYPTIEKNILKAYGMGRVLVTLHTTDGSELYKQKIIPVENVNYTDIVKPEKEEPEREFENSYYEKEQGMKIISDNGVYSVREIAGQLRLKGEAPNNKKIESLTWSVSQIDGDIWQMAIDEAYGLLSVSGKGRVLVTAGGMVDGTPVMARKVIEVGNLEYQDEKPTIFLNLYIDHKDIDDDEPVIEQDKRYTFKVEDYDEKEYKNTDLTWSVSEKEKTIESVDLSSSGKIEVEGYGKVMIQAYGESSDGNSWLIGYKEIEVEKDKDDEDKEDEDED
jgi:rRNA maturation protein Nop10